MHDTLQAARKRARQWREAQDPPVANGLVIVLDGLFVGWAAELPPAEQWAPGCVAIAGDERAHFLRPTDWRGGCEWADMGLPTETPAEPSPPESESTTDP